MPNVFIYFDLETTSKYPGNARIIQIGAVHEDGSEFEKIIMPEVDIDPEASEVNGFTCNGGRLYRSNMQVFDTVSPSQGLYDFVTWIRNNPSNRNKNIWLVAHNAFRFDMPVLVSNLNEYEISSNAITGFCDSLKCFRYHLPGFDSYALNNLLRWYAIQQYQSHDALQDAKDLKTLIQRGRRQMPVEQFLSERIFPLSN